MSTTTHKDKDSTRSHEQQQIEILTPPAKAAFECRLGAREQQAAEKTNIAELKRLAVEIGASAKVVTATLVLAGYPFRSAQTIARDVNSVQRDPVLKEQVINRESSFNAAAEAARYNRKVQDPEKAMDMLRLYIDRASRLAIDNELSQEEFIGRCTAGYTRAKNRKTN